MKKINFTYFITILFLILLTTTDGNEKIIYDSIRDITNPTSEDYQKIQEYLKNGKRELLPLLSISANPNEKYYRYDLRAKNFRILPTEKNQTIIHETYTYNTDSNDKERCIICYCSFNGNYPKGILRIDKALKKIGYKGHFIVRIGGWPNTEQGDLQLSHVPYAFKPCFFEEAKNLGYKNVLWLDSSIIPLKELTSVFKKIEDTGYFGYISCHKVVDYSTNHILNTFNIDRKMAEKILTVEGGVFGLNLASTEGQVILSEWKKSAINGGFYSARPDQNSLSIISYLLHLENWDSTRTRADTLRSINNNTIFCVDHTFSDIN
jgi:hypothetical protein